MKKAILVLFVTLIMVQSALALNPIEEFLTNIFNGQPLFSASAPATCSDSDGINPNVKGERCSSGEAFGKAFDSCRPDYCHYGKKQVMELGCDGTAPTSQLITCPSGCDDGACIGGTKYYPPVEPTPTPAPTRNINNYNPGTDFVAPQPTPTECKDGAERGHFCPTSGKAQAEECIGGKWIIIEDYCSSNEVCVNGECRIDTSKRCFNECEELGARRKATQQPGIQYYEICGDADEDPCFEWKLQSCPKNRDGVQTFFNEKEGYCASACYHEDEFCTPDKSGIIQASPIEKYPADGNCKYEEKIVDCPENYVCQEFKDDGSYCIPRIETRLAPPEYFPEQEGNECYYYREFKLKFGETKFGWDVSDDISTFAVKNVKTTGDTGTTFNAKFIKHITEACAEPLLVMSGNRNNHELSPVILRDELGLTNVDPSECEGGVVNVELDLKSRFEELGQYFFDADIRCGSFSSARSIIPEEERIERISFTVKNPERGWFWSFFNPRKITLYNEFDEQTNVQEMSMGEYVEMSFDYENGEEGDVILFEFNRNKIKSIIPSKNGYVLAGRHPGLHTAVKSTDNSIDGYRLSGDGHYKLLVITEDAPPEGIIYYQVQDALGNRIVSEKEIKVI